jgi:threonine-phosphate decarboxylase
VFDHGGTIHNTARLAGLAPEQILDLSASINPLGPSKAVRQAILDSLELIVHYPDPYADQLKAALADYHQIDPASIIPTNGSTSAIHLLPSVIKGSTALIVAPAFSEYATALARNNWQIIYHLLTPDNGFNLDLDKLAETVRKHRPDLLFFCNPANPTGILYTKARIRELLALCKSSDTVLVLDEAFMDFCGEEQSSIHDLLAFGSGVVLRSMTKFHALAGLRLGCAIASPAIAAQLRAAVLPWEVNSLAQAAGIAALQDTDHAKATIALIADQRSWLLENLAELPGLKAASSNTNYLLIELTGTMDSSCLKERMFSNQRIMIRDCSSFAGLSNRFVRVAIRDRQDNQRLVDGLKHELG